MGRYIEALTGQPRSGAKAIKDAVWGMIDIRPREVVVLDSPPLQRLRRVRQLGLGYLTYPTAVYSRFEHSVGAMHQAERMLRAIALRSDDRIQEELLRETELVRLAALIHDVGHLPLSHVSERYFSTEECTNPDLASAADDLQVEVARELSIPMKPLAECLSVALICTPSFHRLLCEVAGYDSEVVAAAALAIAGKAPDTRRAFIAQLISNVVDADKLDYMFRDARATGVPLAVDLERLLFKLKCLEVSAVDLRGPLKDTANVGDRLLVLGTDVSGDRLAYDLAQARVMLFERVYLHHKTRSAERVVLRALDRLGLDPIDLLGWDDDLFGRHGASQFDGAIEPEVEMVLWRRLPRRGFALSSSFLVPRPLTESETDFRTEWAALEKALGTATTRRDLEDAIRQEAAALAEIIADGRRPDDIWIDTTPAPPRTGESQLVIESPDGTIRTDPAYPPTAAAGAHDPRVVTFIYVSGARASLPLTYIATERILARTHGTYFTRQSADHAKVSWSDIQEIKQEIEREDPDSFDGLWGLRPSSSAARRATNAERIDELATRFHHFNVYRDVSVDHRRIVRFLDQFPEQLVLPMLSVLESVEFLSRDNLGGQFASRLADDADEATVFVPLTAEYTKSASHLPYFLADNHAQLRIMSLADALGAPDASRLVVFDDVLISGVQSGEVVDTWFGDAENSDSIVLSPDARDALREKDVRFRFGYAWAPGLDALRDAAVRHQLGADVDALTVDEVERPLDGVANGEALRTFLARVGFEVLSSTKGARSDDPWSADKCEERAVGYGNSERLVVLPYNTPTGTITALWKTGAFSGADWMPLFPRRGELPLEEQSLDAGER